MALVWTFGSDGRWGAYLSAGGANLLYQGSHAIGYSGDHRVRGRIADVNIPGKVL